MTLSIFFTKIVNFFGSILSAASLGIAGIPSLVFGLGIEPSLGVIDSKMD